MVEIRKTITNDVDSIVELETKYLGETLGKEMLTEEINRGVAAFLTALVDNKVVGYIGGYFILNEGEILNFVVDEAYQRKGIGTLLFNELLKMYPNTLSITLEVRESNIKAQAFYKKMGFIEISKRLNYYSNGENAILLRKELNHDYPCD